MYKFVYKYILNRRLTLLFSVNVWCLWHIRQAVLINEALKGLISDHKIVADVEIILI